MEGERPLSVGSRRLWLLPQAASFALLAVQVTFLGWSAVLFVRGEEPAFTWLFSAFVPGAASAMFANAAQIGPTNAGKQLAAAACAVLPGYAIVVALIFALLPADLRLTIIGFVCALAVALSIVCGIMTERFVRDRTARERDRAGIDTWRAQPR